MRFLKKEEANGILKGPIKMNFFQIVPRVKDIYFDKGLYAVTLLIVKRIVRIFCETNSATWYVRMLNDDVLSYKACPNIQTEINFNSFEETITWLKGCADKWVYNQKEVKIARKQNHHFPNIRYKGKLIGYMKVGFGKVYIQDYQGIIEFPENTAFIYDTYILQEFRSLSIGSFLINEVCKFLKHKGYERVTCHIPDWNIPSKKAYLRVGFKPIRSIRWIRILNFHFFTARPATL